MSLSQRTKDGQAEETALQLAISESLEDAPESKVHPEDWKELWDAFDCYYEENGKLIQEAAQLDMTKDVQGPSKRSIRYEAAFTSFLDNAKTILQGLKFLSDIHPVISVAVGAFGAVIDIELMRRDNNVKAMSAKLQMQNLMCALFQIRELRTGWQDLANNLGLANLMQQIAVAIKDCGSDLIYYKETRLISRLFHANAFQDRLVTHITTFAEQRSQLVLFLSSYTTRRVHEAAVKIECLAADVKSLVVAVLQELDSPQEKEANAFIEANGGIEKCIKDDGLLEQLLNKTGDNVAGEAGKRKLKTQLFKELKASVEEVLENNMADFKGMLRIHEHNLAHLMDNHTSQIVMNISKAITTLLPGTQKHVLLTDPLLQKIWTEMVGLRQSVRAQKFVLTFKDYHIIRMKPPKTPTFLATPNAPLVKLPPSTDLESSSLKTLPESEAFTLGGGSVDQQLIEDEWALNYIDVVHLDPIVEAIDDDFSGFISIHEANRFAVARPRGWGLLRWFAYWAAGWGISIKNYKDQIYKLVQEIFEARLDVLPCNWSTVGDYLDSPAFRSLDSLLRSTRPHIEEHDAADSKLKDLIMDFDEKQKQRLLLNLQEIQYRVSSTEKLALVTGPGRIERFAFPLVYLLLKHHLRVVRLSSQRRLCSQEMPEHSSSLLTVTEALRQRGDKLEGESLILSPYVGQPSEQDLAAIFRQSSRSAQDQFKKFSFGMFERFSSPEPYAAKNNSMLTSYYESNLTLKYKSPALESDLEEAKETSKHLAHDLDHDVDRPEHEWTTAGRWTGLMSRDPGLHFVQKDLLFLFLRFDFPEPTATEFEGTFEGWTGSGKSMTAELKGTVKWAEPLERLENEDGIGNVEDRDDGPIMLALDFTAAVTSGGESSFHVTPVGDQTSLHWKGEWETPNSAGRWPFNLLRVPHEGIQFRHILEDALVTVVGEPHSEPSQNGVEEVADFQPRGYSTKDPVDHAPDFSTGSLVMEPSRKIALARWRYAGETILHQVRRQQRSMSYFNEMADERRRWITASMKIAHRENTTAEMRDYLALCISVHPNILGIWEATAEFYLERQVGESITSDTICDSCANTYCFLRHVCITCCLETLDNHIDICETCIDKQDIITTEDFTHRPSHTVLKTRRRIPHMEFPHLITKARIRSKRVKASFRGAGSHHHGGPSKQQERRCACCETEINLPCWVCVVCTLPRRQDTLICMECESDRRQKGKHDTSHYLLRISDSADVEGPGPGDPAEKYFNEAKSMLSQLETKIENRVEALLTAHAEKLQQPIPKDCSDSTGADVSWALNGDPNTGDVRVAAVERRLDNLERQVNSRFETLEVMLQRIIEAVDQGK